MKHRHVLEVLVLLVVAVVTNCGGLLDAAARRPGVATAAATSVPMPVTTSFARVPVTPAPAPPDPTTTAPPPSPTEPTPPAPSPSSAPVPTAPVRAAVVARVVTPTVAVSPEIGAAPTTILGATTEFGTPRVLLATERRGDWVRVRLPVRPNDAQGWVPAAAVVLEDVFDVIQVDLSTRTLTWVHDGAVALQVPVAVGAPGSPTPPGQYFVTDVLAYPRYGSYGAWVLALNGHSDAFSEFDGGDPRIAIHGTDDPSSIGAAASAGCVRVAADPLALLAAGIAPGTPVVIT